ncbi:flagellin [Pararhizobium sp. IMCC21322]|uniref:flagellin n=1 Tax=Pararhizobium sp. IMCC21322 TaxID=3067903 RepID=UPI00274099AA|nr:flagellin [Pararhizobium sp. IMCC21322]
MVDALVGSRSTSIVRDLVQLRQSMSGLEQQLATGRKSETYAGIGSERSLSIAFRSDVSRLESYQSSITLIELRLSISDQVLTRMDGVATEARGSMDPNIYQLLGDGRSQGQVTSHNLLGETLSMLNSEAGGRYLFAGQDVSNKPVETVNAVMDGEGNRAGFVQHRDERLLADTGASGTGRVDVTQPSTTQVQMAEDGVHPFGVKIEGVSNGLTNTVLTGPTAAPATFDVEFTGQPIAGETLSVSVTLPDGTTQNIELVAAAAGQGSDNAFEIGATPDATASNLAAALTDTLEQLTAVDVRAASAMAAGADFFDYDGGGVPQRIDGPPFDSATGLRDGTESDTVFWYTGDNSTDSARSTATARIDDNLTVSYGARANEEAFRVLVQNLAVFSSSTFTEDNQNDEIRYGLLADKTLQNISYPAGVQKLEQIAGELSAARSAANNANTRHNVKTGTLKTLVDGIESADLNEVSVNLLTLQTRLEASYRATSILFDMSLVNYI